MAAQMLGRWILQWILRLIEYASGDSQAIIDNIINILSPLNSQEVFLYMLKYGLE